MSDKIKEQYRQYLNLDVEYPEGHRSCAHCERSLLPEDFPLEMEYATEGTRFVYRFCQQDHVEEGWPPKEYPDD